MAWPGDWTLIDTAGADSPQAFLYLDCETIKVQGLLCFRVLPQRHQLELLFCYLVVAPQFNYFEELDIRDSAVGDLGSVR